MPEPTTRTILTPLGVVQGRSSLFLDRLEFSRYEAAVTLNGTYYGHLRSHPWTDSIRYSFRFIDVLAFRVTELDSWPAMSELSSDSNIYEILNSPWTPGLGGKVTSEDRHIVVETYDDVVEIICHDFELLVEPPQERPARIGEDAVWMEGLP